MDPELKRDLKSNIMKANTLESTSAKVEDLIVSGNTKLSELEVESWKNNTLEVHDLIAKGNSTFISIRLDESLDAKNIQSENRFKFLWKTST